MAEGRHIDAETERLAADARREKNWKRWGPYLAERQWGTVREDYSPDGSCWEYFPHAHARSRAYRWGEDGLLGITDRECRLCFALALWNGRDPILKERLFGLTNPEGNHGEDVKECYFYLDATPTSSYLKALYKYPQAEFPYARLVEENRRRSRKDPEFELLDTGVFDDHRYFDVFVEYAKSSPNDILIRVTAANRGPEAATLHLLPTVWFRNTWSWGCLHEGCTAKPELRQAGEGARALRAPDLGAGSTFVPVRIAGGRCRRCCSPTTTRTTNGSSRPPTKARYVKDAFHDYVIHGRSDAVNPAATGTKAAAHYVLNIAAQDSTTVELRLFAEEEAPREPFGADFDRVFADRIGEAEEFYRNRIPPGASDDDRRISRQAYAGLLWTKQFYHYVVKEWLDGDPGQPPPPASRRQGRNKDWGHLFNRDVISMPDKWEYPWYAAWDSAFHMIPMAEIDPHFAKEQLILFLREWYMHPSGQLPAYEFALGRRQPAGPCLGLLAGLQDDRAARARDRLFLARVFQKLLINFTWWVNRKDVTGKYLFAGGFLGLDNISLFDRSKQLPSGAVLEQADGTAWMAFYCVTMLAMALELAKEDPAYEDVASKFFEHFVAIADAMNHLGGTGLWDEEDGFYYDQLQVGGQIDPPADSFPGGNHSAVRRGDFGRPDDRPAARVPEAPAVVSRQPPRSGQAGFLSGTAGPAAARAAGCWPFLRARGWNASSAMCSTRTSSCRPSASARCRASIRIGLTRARPAASCSASTMSRATSTTGLFGGNSNWRGPIWMPVNYLLVEALERYHHFYGDTLAGGMPHRLGPADESAGSGARVGRSAGANLSSR